MILRSAPRSGAFLQSFAWGEVERRRGKRVAYLAHKDALGLVVQTSLPLLGSYRYVARGPIAPHVQQTRVWFDMVRAEATEATFLRVDPLVDLQSMQGVRTVKDVQPSVTWQTDLTVSTENLWAAMHSKARYNVRLAEKKGVTVTIGREGMEDFLPLLQQTTDRHAIRSHTDEHYRHLIEVLDGHDQNPLALLAVARAEGVPVAAAIVLDFGEVRTYLHGASSYADRSLMAPHLLHMRMMQDAMDRGLRVYDWWGIAPEGSVGHPLEGVSRFKKQFGGRMLSFPPTVDLVLKPHDYAFYRAMRLLARLRR